MRWWILPVGSRIGLSVLVVGLLLLLGQRGQAQGLPGGKERSQEDERSIARRMEALAAMGEKGVLALAKELRQGNTEVQQQALRVLKDLGPEALPALDAIAGALSSRDLDTKRLAARTLKAIGPKARNAVAALIEAGKETRDFRGSFTFGGSSNVADAVLEAVRVIDPEAIPRLAQAMIPGLLQVIEKGPVEGRRNATALLRHLGPHAHSVLPRLKELLPDQPGEMAKEVLSLFRDAGEEGMSQLVSLMEDPETSNQLKVALVQSYGWPEQAGPSTIRILRHFLQDRSAPVRVGAVRVLERVRSRELIPLLASLLEDQELLRVPGDSLARDQFAVADAMAAQGKDAIPSLVKSLESKASLARFQSARALGKMGPAARETVAALKMRLEDPVLIVQLEIARAILKVDHKGEEAVKKLQQALEDEPRLQGFILEGIRDVGRPALPLFPAIRKVILASRNTQLQRLGLETVQAIKAEPREVARLWATLAQKSTSFLYTVPRDAIRTHPQDVAEALPRLREYLRKGEDVNVRHHAAEVIMLMGTTAEEAIPDLIEAVDDQPFVSHTAMEALSALGSKARAAVPVLIRRFEKIGPGDREPDYERRQILEALERFGPVAVEAVPRLVKWMPQHPQAARVLGKIGPAARSALSELEQLSKGESAAGRAWAAFALVRITGKKEPHVRELARMYRQGKIASHREEALLALAELGTDARAALPVFLLALKEKDETPYTLRPTPRMIAARALVHFGPEAREAVPDLIEIIKLPSFGGKSHAIEALGAIGPDARAAIPVLRKLAAEEDRYRPEIEKALARIEKK